ncbi:MAG TPA: NAD-dependent epimerase/dehydratase family protein [Kouleothrix sp.]|uniref:NAD-dependent epimerase/dehydratase family protein n=1 Tax=Kouleothrix sp. TaxID=2779161 RepID=UPI002C3E9A95|nr:NAD-dependent epimerase/dehydratase family protein [Kouleothrix sp.]HRC74672.1 NAD-dependent epimerase/dehydratase family protein [Kouleothrix sp.]
MHILITGSSGQIGTNLALRLLDAGHRVFGVDKRLNSWTDRVVTMLQDLAAPYRDFAGGIGGVPYPQPDLVVHLAANAKVHELVQFPHRAMENIALTFNVLEYCRHNDLPLIFSSSREVYGDIHRYITEEQHADFSFTESPYSASKVAGEALVYSYARCYGLRYLVFRFSNVYGRYDNDIERMERVIPLFIQRMRQGLPVTVYGHEKTLDFTYIDDCVGGIVAGIERLLSGQVRNQTINLAYGQGNTLVRMAELIAEALDVPGQITVEPSKRVGEVTRYIADISRAAELLDYQPQVPLDEGIRRAVAWSSAWEARKEFDARGD